MTAGADKRSRRSVTLQVLRDLRAPATSGKLRGEYACVLHGSRDQIADFLRAVAHLAGGQGLEFFADGLDNGVFDGGRGFGFTQEVEHESAGADGGERVDNILTRVFRCAAADGL